MAFIEWREEIEKKTWDLSRRIPTSDSEGENLHPIFILLQNGNWFWL